MNSLPQPERFYAGEFRHSLDEKNRVTIPSRWRRTQGEEFILLPQATQQFLLVISPEDFARMSSAVESNEGVTARDRRRLAASRRPRLRRGRRGPSRGRIH